MIELPTLTHHHLRSFSSGSVLYIYLLLNGLVVAVMLATIDSTFPFMHAQNREYEVWVGVEHLRHTTSLMSVSPIHKQGGT